MASLYYIILLAIALFLMLFIFMYQAYKYFIQKIEIQKREYIQSILDVQERERWIIALEVHDNLGPLLSITNMQLEALMINEDSKEKKEDLLEIHGQIKRAVAICRDISHELTPFLNDNTNLEHMVREYLQKINTTGKITVQFECNIGPVIISKQHAASICRIILELLTNTIKHAEATRVHIKIDINSGFLLLEYLDNGIGIQKKNNAGIGIKNIQSRVLLLNGQLQIGKNEDKGIKVNIKVPTKTLHKS